MKKAVFLDRDGVINEERGEYTFKLEDFKILEDVFSTLKVISERGFLLIIISNQGGIARGIYSKEDVELLHTFLLNEFKKNGLELTEILYCPHYPDFSNCICRKPDSLLIEKSIARYNIDVHKSYFIGDKERDIEAAQKVRIKGIKINANDSLKSVLNLIN